MTGDSNGTVLGGTFGLQVSLSKGQRDTADTFEALSELLRSLESIDRDLAERLNPAIQPRLVLDSIEVGSLRIWLVTELLRIPDEVLRPGQFKLIIGHFLVRAKYLLIDLLRDKSTIHKSSELDGVRGELERERRLVSMLPGAQISEPVSNELVLLTAQKLSAALSHFPQQQRIVYKSPDGEVPFNRDFTLSDEQVAGLLNREKITGWQDMELVVKKPDYLGDSRWELQAQGRAISAKIVDTDWLARFRKRQIDLRPGDALRCRVRIDTYKDDAGKEMAGKFTVEEVRSIACRSVQQDALRQETDVPIEADVPVGAATS